MVLIYNVVELFGRECFREYFTVLDEACQVKKSRLKSAVL
jgi:hypothetical protein